MILSLFSLHVPYVFANTGVAISPLCQALLGVGDGGFDLHYLFPQREEIIFVATSF